MAHWLRRFLIFGLLSSATAVVEKSKLYSCHGDGSTTPELPVDRHCDQGWTSDGTLFAHYKDGPNGCISPCKEVFSGKIALSKCDNVTLAIVCSNMENGTVDETRITFFATGESIGNKAQFLVTTTPGQNGAAPKDHRFRYGLVACAALLILLIL